MVDEPLKGTGFFLARKIQTAEGRISIVGFENGGGACGREWEYPLDAENSPCLTASKEIGPQTYNHKEMNLATMTQLESLPLVPGVNAAWPVHWFKSCEKLSRAQTCHAQTTKLCANK